MISLLLFKQIAQLFLVMLVGFCLVRCGLLKPKDSRVLSVVALYASTPCVIIKSFQMECTPEMLRSLALSLGSAVLIHLVMFLLVYLLRQFSSRRHDDRIQFIRIMVIKSEVSKKR